MAVLRSRRTCGVRIVTVGGQRDCAANVSVVGLLLATGVRWLETKGRKCGEMVDYVLQVGWMVDVMMSK